MRLAIGAAALLLIACTPHAASSPTAAASPSTSAVPTVAAVQTPAPIASRTQPPYLTLPRDDLAGRLRPLANGWRPEGRTLLVGTGGGPEVTTITAVPLTGTGPDVPLVSYTRSTGAQWRPDGSALAIGLQTSVDAARIATWDLGSGAIRWVTQDEPGIWHESPVWSADGTAIYYAAHAMTATTYEDRGMFRISLDGSRKAMVRAPSENGGMPERLTPDGGGLVFARVRAGGSTDVLDLATGVDHEFDRTTTSSSLAWRSARPRALVMSGGCCAGRPGGALVLWDDIAGTKTELIGPTATPTIAAGSADWDPTGTKIAVAIYERSGRVDAPSSIAQMDVSGGHRTAIPGTDGAGRIMWFPEGIVFTKFTSGRGTEIVLASPAGDSSQVLYRSPDPSGLQLIVSVGV
jgi:hypothetical protein